MTVKTTRYQRKPFEVEAIQVTAENMEDVAQWCEGKVIEESIGKLFIKVDVKQVFNDRQTRAYINDWVLSGVGGFKIFTPKAFTKSFVKVKPGNDGASRKRRPRKKRPHKPATPQQRKEGS